ncbi:6-phospho-3-hexuloisomerase [Fulvivirga sediminis]|uniref:6-phospho-3-hexuloisomerase n=1 Tax=Fulvivirga sediminis TaxID=2803949 RepID=A0A937F2G9_9BACT|nr:6-phospho-3-hexuloisomerase [Fulvivirga sediminis]MBL3655086.1 6-phospho-3-hexuloisomerase [Fulvivirga sediminis]
MNTSTTTEAKAIKNALEMILNEHQELSKRLTFEPITSIIPALNEAKNIFLIGAGRTGFMINAAAMRLMHLGYSAYVVGETTTPAIGEGDVLIAASGSGTTSSIVKAGETAKKVGATLICFTTNATSPLAETADYTVTIPAAGKQDHNTKVSSQYAGSLFEQGFLLLFDALIHELWNIDGSSAEELWTRHANME